MINSQGKQVSQQHLDDQARIQAYLADLRALGEKKDANGGVFTVEMAAEYREILLRHEMVDPKVLIKWTNPRVPGQPLVKMLKKGG